MSRITKPHHRPRLTIVIPTRDAMVKAKKASTPVPPPSPVFLGGENFYLDLAELGESDDCAFYSE